MDNSTTTASSIEPTFFSRLIYSFKRQWQSNLDNSVPHVYARWVVLCISLLIFIARAFTINGFYIVTYGLAIYSLNLLIGFLSPQIETDSDEPLLPTLQKDEFKPFVRKLPEFKCWYSGQRAVSIAFVMTFIGIFDIPVFWPILLIYFFFLFFLTMRRQIQHMMRHKYLPFSFGKPKFSGSKKSASKPVTPVSGVSSSGVGVSMSQPRPTLSTPVMPKMTPAPPTSMGAPAGFSGYVPTSTGTIRNVNGTRN
eukprot:40546_1